MSNGVKKKLSSIPKIKLLVSYVNVLITPEFSRRLESRRQSPMYIIIIRDNFIIKPSNQQLGSRCFVIKQKICKVRVEIT